MPRSASPLGRQLEVYEESWQVEHEEVKQHLWRTEDNLAVGLALFKAIHDRYWSWHGRVRSGVEEYLPDDDAEYRERFVWWLRPCKSVKNQLVKLEAQYGTGCVDGGREFHRFCEEARQILESWKAPVVAETLLKGVPAHARHVRSAEEMASELDRVSRPAPAKSVPMMHKTDDSQVF